MTILLHKNEQYKVVDIQEKSNNLKTISKPLLYAVLFIAS